MPSRTRVSWSQLKVGVIALVALAILAVLIFLLTSSGGLFQQYVTLKTFMDDASGLQTKAPVRLNGFTIGYVEDIHLTGSRAANRAIEIDMSVQAQYLKFIPKDSVAVIAASSLLGDKYINITRGSSAQMAQAGGVLTGSSPQDIPELMAASANLLQTLQGITNRVDTMLADIEKGQGNIGKLLKDEELYRRLNAVAAESQQLLNDVRTGKGTVSKLLYDDALYQDIRASVNRLNAMMAALQAGQGTAGKLLNDPALYNEAARVTTELRDLIASINHGRGTAGKLIHDDQLYNRTSLLMSKLNDTIDKINSGRGTLGQLIVNPQLYSTLNTTMVEIHSLVKDIRANPKKFLSLKLALF